MTLRHVVLRTLAVAVLAFLASPLPAQDAQPAPVWPKLTQAQRDEVQRFGEDFKQFIGRARSAVTFVREAAGLPRAGEDSLVAAIAMTHT